METEDLILFLYGCVFLTEVKRALNRHYINRLKLLRVIQVIFSATYSMKITFDTGNLALGKIDSHGKN